MVKYTFYVGLNDKKSKAQEIGTVDAFKIAGNLFAGLTGGATIHEARGVYTHESGEIVIENNLICEVFGELDGEGIERIGAALRAAFNQESIIFEQTETKSSFLY